MPGLSADQSCNSLGFSEFCSPLLPPLGKPWQAGLSQASVYKIISFLCPQPPLVTIILPSSPELSGHGKCDFTPQGFSALTKWHWRKKKKERFCPFWVERAPALLLPSPESGPEAPRGSSRDGQAASPSPQTGRVLGGAARERVTEEKCPRQKINSACLAIP